MNGEDGCVFVGNFIAANETVEEGGEQGWEEGGGGVRVGRLWV